MNDLAPKLISYMKEGKKSQAIMLSQQTYYISWAHRWRRVLNLPVVSILLNIFLVIN